MRFLLISFFLLSLTSCKSLTNNGLTETPVATSVYNNPYFSDVTIDYVYKSKIEVYGRNFGGIVVIKKLRKAHHRVVFTTEFGSKIFDFEFNNNTFKVNFIVEDLNKKILVNTLKKDFRLLLQEENVIEKQYKNPEYTIYQSQNDNRFNFYFINTENDRLEKLVNTSKTKEKVVINFESIDGKLADKILIEHQNIQLKIDLKHIDTN